MARAKLPLNPAATKAADAALYSQTDPPGRKLDPKNPKDRELRKKWMEAYEKAGGAVTSSSAGSRTDTPVEKCPINHWIELRYLHHDGTPVKSAAAHISSPAYSTDTKLAPNGFVHIDGVPPISGFTFHFDADPEEYKPAGPSLPSSGAPKAEAVSAFDSAIGWVWGTVQGDFNKDQSTSQLVVNTVLGVIPLVDQVLDVRDLISGVRDLVDYYTETDEQQKSHPDSLGLSYETWLWIGLFLIALGCIPEVGSVVKGALKGLIKFLQKAGKTAADLSPQDLRRLWELLLRILNYLGIHPGNAHRWLKVDFPNHLDEWMSIAAKKIDSVFKAFAEVLDKAEQFARKLPGNTAQAFLIRARNYRTGLTKAWRKLEEMKTVVNRWIREQIQKAVGGKHNFDANGKIDTSPPTSPGTNVRKQEAEPPPELDAIARAAKRKELGLGLKDPKKGLDYNDWAHKNGWSTYGELSGSGSFEKQINEAMTGADKIHFNLDGVNTSKANGRLTEYGEPAAGYTNYELHLLKTKPEYAAKVTWYKGGEPMPPGWSPW